MKVNIQNPCSQNWDKMDKISDGKYCNFCSSKVIDFTSMTDKQVLNFLSNSSGNVCGRISKNQLNRNLNIKPKKNRWRFLMATFISLFIMSKSQSQTKSDTTQIVLCDSIKSKSDTSFSKIDVNINNIDTNITNTNPIIMGGIEFVNKVNWKSRIKNFWKMLN